MAKKPVSRQAPPTSRATAARRAGSADIKPAMSRMGICVIERPRADIVAHSSGGEMRAVALALMAIGLLLAGCQSVPPGGAADRAQVTLTFTCTTSAAVPNASYVGAYAGVETAVTATDAARDVYCADDFKARKYPHGFVTIFGSSRISQNNRACDAAGKCDATLQQNDRIYAAVRDFAATWTARHGKRHPIMAGAGPGLMLAAAEGAKA